MERREPDLPREDDYRWLISSPGREWLQRASEFQGSLVALTQSLRKGLSADRTHLVLEQTDLRHRAQEKFSRASRMFFARELLEQATDEQIARYKAVRCRPSGSFSGPIADLCCGVGGDLLALAESGLAVGADVNPIAVLLARANLENLSLAHGSVRLADVRQQAWDEYAAIHIDPDRRPHGGRTVRVEHSEPGLDFLTQLVQSERPLAIKLAPAAQVPELWSARCQLEWIGSRGECRQQVAWFGGLEKCNPLTNSGMPGRAATVIWPGTAPRTIMGCGDERLPIVDQIGRYICEPHPAVIAAQLVSRLAEEHDLAGIEPGIAYLTGDRLVSDRALAVFEVFEVLPCDLRRLKATLRPRRMGHLEVKKRGVPHDPRQIARALEVPGDESATLLLMPVRGCTTAILARRL